MNQPAGPLHNAPLFRSHIFSTAIEMLVVTTGITIGAASTLLAADSQAVDAQPSHSPVPAAASAQPASLTFSLQSRGEDGKPVVREESIDPRKTGIIVVDPWNFHWCKTATMRVDALIPRINRSLAACRELGMTIMLCPSDVVDHYVGWPQREIVLAMEKRRVPSFQIIECPAPPAGGGCACGHDKCVPNFGWDAMHPDLKIGTDDLMPDTLEDVWSIGQNRHLTHLIYAGVHTEICLLGKPMGLRNLKAVGMKCILARDLTDAHPDYDPKRNVTPDGHTAQVVAHFERYLAPTIMMSDELAKVGKWDRSAIIDPVRITPWGTSMRPHLFVDDVTVTLSSPLEPNAELRYTTDGSEPTARSNRYEKPITFADDTRIRVAGFVGSQRICLDSEGVFCKLRPVPPDPDVPLADAELLRSVGHGHTYNGQIRAAPHGIPAQKDKSNEGQSLRVGGVNYQHGYGVHAPNQLMFALKPDYKRFVALTGVDEHLLDTSAGSNEAMYPSVVFKVFIDGHEMASSPVMRISFQPWRFDVTIPPGSRVISLATTDASDGNKFDLANWLNCGFMTGETIKLTGQNKSH
jgi:nicotinamidase-related amidase